MHSEEEAQGICDYVQWQSRRHKAKVLHAEKVANERVMGRDYDVWNVNTNEKVDNRWWVVTSPTNLCSQRLMPSTDYVLSFHIGATMRMEAHPGAWRNGSRAGIASSDHSETHPSWRRC